MIDRSAQRAAMLSRKLGTFIDAQYAVYTREEIMAALRLALAIETELSGNECSECGSTTDEHGLDCPHHWTQTVGAP